MKFTDTAVVGSATSSSKIPCETASQKGYITPLGIYQKGKNDGVLTRTAAQGAPEDRLASLEVAISDISLGATISFIYNGAIEIYEGVSSSPTGNQFVVAGSLDDTITNLINVVSANSSKVNIELVSAGIINIISAIEGEDGNQVTGIVSIGFDCDITPGDTFALTGGSEKPDAVAVGQMLRVGDSAPYTWYKAASISPTVWQKETSSEIEISHLPIVSREEAIHHFYDQLLDFQKAEYPADEKYLCVAGAGDSMGTDTGFMKHLVNEMTRRFGQGCVGTAGLILSVGAGQYTTTVTGTGTITYSFAYLPNGEYYSINSGQSVIETPGSANIHSGYTKIRCFYGIKTGGGTLTFSVSQTGATISNKVVNTSTGTDGSIGYVDFEVADGLLKNGKPILTVAASVANAHYIGCVMYLGSGMVPIRIGRGGSSAGQALTGLASNISTICNALNISLIGFASKETDEDETLVNLENLIDRWHNQYPNCTYILVGATPSPSAENDVDPAQNALLKEKSNQYKWTFVDGQRLLRSVSYMNTIGSTADGWNEVGGSGPHLSDNAQYFISAFVIDKVLMSFNTVLGRNSSIGIEQLRMQILSNTIIPAHIWSQNASTYGGSNFGHTTPDNGRMTFTWSNSPAPIANSGRGGVIQSVGPMMNSRAMYRYRIFDGQLENDIMAVILVGGQNQNEANGLVTTGVSGYRIIHGCDLISGQNIPWIRFAVKGTGTSETLSPKIYHSSSSGSSPYAGGTWRPSSSNMYWVEYIGNGTSATKRFRAWHQSCSTGSSETRVGPRRMIADWSGNITVGGTPSSATHFSLIAGASPTTPGGSRSCSLEHFQVDVSPRYTTDFWSQDMNL